ncbi:MAG TPA: class I SAM-dependent methyltransferase, partial [Bacteroidia bacterium]|nr:class I SAM-dependent methyltransferase [Bacteroidia bacterium]
SGEVSKFLKRKCAGYSSSHYFSDVPRGEYKGEFRSEDLSAMTFPDRSFDLIITSDVFEHVFEPAKAFSEINRVLKPGGMHIFTMPWIPWQKTTQQRAKLLPDGTIEYFKKAEYHGNPIGGGKGSLVTFDWGLDFTDFIYNNSGMTTTIYLEVDRKKGLDGKFLEVFISRKPNE